MLKNIKFFFTYYTDTVSFLNKKTEFSKIKQHNQLISMNKIEFL